MKVWIKFKFANWVLKKYLKSYSPKLNFFRQNLISNIFLRGIQTMTDLKLILLSIIHFGRKFKHPKFRWIFSWSSTTTTTQEYFHGGIRAAHCCYYRIEAYRINIAWTWSTQSDPTKANIRTKYAPQNWNIYF